ncbi:hypothetical protein [Limnoglobus roseus]|uniref:Uncharacterized protein n=1 Tax=Limnoglobus roseus TaxID=2598579 RepID=A0A5C1AKD2_9BACT|nr:hypothetical protein [Limnoglobus roseus]QEL18466.1 hypothetical protein PX52LOC_05491 [Limnoglobus roseus]
MSLSSAVKEFRARWLPNATSNGLTRMVSLLEQGSPLLIHGAFSRCASQGCLATHLAWHHPQTQALHAEAGVVWLTKIARMNPATSALLLEWDRSGVHNWELREDLLSECRQELERRAEGTDARHRREECCTV